MNAQAILQKIEDDARSAAAKLQEDAEQKTEKLLNASAEKVQSMKAQTEKQAQSENEAQKDRMHRMAELELRKQLLAKKRLVINEAFDAAKEQLCAQPKAVTRAFLLESVAKTAQGDEKLLVGADHDEWFDDSFLSELNQKLGGKLTLEEGRRQGVTGAVLLRGGTEVYITYESLVSNARIDLETEIAKILFNE